MSEVIQDNVEQVEVTVIATEEPTVAVEATPIVQEESATTTTTNDDIVMKETETAPVVEQPPNVHAVLGQLSAIFDPANLEKDNFFRELVERNAEGCKCFY